MSFRGSEASRGIFPSGKLYLALVILATWEDPSTPFHFGRDDMSVGGSIQPHRLYSERGGRQIAAPTDTPVGDTVYPHGLYLPRSGTAHRPFPTVSLVGGFFHPHGLYSLRCLVVLRAANQNLLIASGNHTMISSAICRPPRCIYNPCG